MNGNLAGEAPVEQPVGRPAPERATLTVLADPVADALDDMAALGTHWARNRERGRMPSGIRAAMLLVAREALAMDDHERRLQAQQFSDLCGPEAYARNSGMCGKCGHPEACAAMGCKTPNVRGNAHLTAAQEVEDEPK